MAAVHRIISVVALLGPFSIKSLLSTPGSDVKADRISYISVGNGAK
jgi:hypothetical protein